MKKIGEFKKENKSQMNIAVHRSVARQFKLICQENDVAMNVVIEDMMITFVSNNLKKRESRNGKDNICR